jgi:hypothetical protein
MHGGEKRSAAECRQSRRINRQIRREAFGERFDYAIGSAVRRNLATVLLP